MQYVRILIAFGWLSGALLAPLAARAEEIPDSSILISEVAWAGSSLSNADEWIELANLSSEPVDLSGWSLEGAASGGEILTLPEGSVIQPNSTYLITNYDAENEKSVLAVKPDFVTTKVSLSNSSLRIDLKDDAGQIVDSAGAGTGPSAGSTGSEDGIFRSMTRISTEDGTLTSSWASSIESNGFDEGATELGTPGTLDSLPSSAKATEDKPGVSPDDNSPNDQTYDPDQNNPPGESEESEPSNEDDDAEADPTDTSTPEETEPNSPPPTYFPTGTLIINEFVSDPVGGSEEWVEILNPYNNTIPLKGWRIKEASGSTTDLPDQYLGFGQIVLVAPINGNLNNDGDTIELLDPRGVIIDSITYGEESQAPATTDPCAAARDIDGSWHETTTPTPGEANVITTIKIEEPKEPEPEPESEPEERSDAREGVIKDSLPAVTPTTLRLSEIYPNTLGDDTEEEFIEIVNIGAEPIELTGWELTDASSSSYTIETGVINPGEIVAMYRNITKLALNNNGTELVQLVAPDGTVVDELQYEKTAKGYSIILNDQAWVWTSTPTPNEPNLVTTNEPKEPESGSDVVEESTAIFAATAPEPPGQEIKKKTKKENIVETDLVSVRDLDLKTKVQVQGTVSVEPGVLGRQIMYLAGSGIQVYFYRANWPELALGDVVEVTGELASSRDETRIKLSSMDDICVIDHTHPPEPHKIKPGEIDEEREGWLVSVTGTIQNIESDRMILEDGESTIKVITKEGTGIDLGEFSEGLSVKVTGIVSQYYEEYRILPRSINDIEVLEDAPTAFIGSTAKDQVVANRSRYAIAITAFTIAILGFFAIRHLRTRINKEPEFNSRTVNYSPTN